MQLPSLRGADDVDAVLAPLGVTSTFPCALLGETPASLARRLLQGPAPKWYLHFNSSGSRVSAAPASSRERPDHCCSLVPHLPATQPEELAHAAATRLKALALWDHDRASWASDLAQGELLVGFSHGTSGIAVGFREQIQLHQGFVPQSALDGAIPETYPRRRIGQQNPWSEHI